ncbi:hypothetical protein JCM5353_001774 [Sporobolomyces roseus]
MFPRHSGPSIVNSTLFVKPIDRLSQLPNELLDCIFDLSHTIDETLSGPLSKRLLPFFHRTFYREILVTSYYRLNKLCTTASNNSGLFSLTRRLDIKIEMMEPGEDRSGWREIKDSRITSDDTLKHLLFQLTALEELEIEGSARLALQSMLSESESEEAKKFPFCKKLTALDLTSTFAFIEDPFEQLLYTGLRQYDKLTSLSFDVRKPDSRSLIHPILVDEYRFRHHVKAPPVDFSSLRDLSLTGSFARSTCPKQFIKRCTSLETLALNETGRVCTLGGILDHLPHPDHIKHLELWLSDDDAEEVDGRTLQQIPRFIDLKTIVVQGPWVPLSPDFYFTLSQLPLEWISFKSDTEVSLEQLLRLVSGPEKMSTLKRITLDNVDAVRGDALPRDHGDEAVRDADLIGLGWNLADWAESFTREGLKRFLEVAEMENVKVDGYAVTALDIEDAWEAEMEYYRSVDPL